MPAGFKDATTDDVYRFLTEAAKKKSKVRDTLETGSPKAVSALLRRYGVKVPNREIPARNARRVPSPEACKQLIEVFGLADKGMRSHWDIGSSALAPLVMAVGHAMPLVVTAERGVTAAG